MLPVKLLEMLTKKESIKVYVQLISQSVPCLLRPDVYSPYYEQHLSYNERNRPETTIQMLLFSDKGRVE